MLPFLAPTLTGSAPFEGAPETACDRLGEHGRHRITQLDPLLRRGAAENIAVVEGLDSGGLAEADRPHLRRVDVAVAVLREVGHDCLAGAVATEPGALVVEHIAAVAHQVTPAVALEGVDTVLAWPQHRVEFEVARVVVAHRVLVEEA